MTRTLPWLIPSVLVAAWQLAATPGLLSAQVLPAPIEVVAAGRNLASSGALWTHMEVSAWPAVPGFVAGGGVSFTLGIGEEANVFHAALGKSADSAARSAERDALRWHPTYAKA